VLLLNSGSIDEDLEGVHWSRQRRCRAHWWCRDKIDYRLLNRAFQLLLGGASLVAMHRNLSWVTTDGAQLDMGAFVAGLELAAGTEAVVVGKPAPEFYAAASGTRSAPSPATLSWWRRRRVRCSWRASHRHPGSARADWQVPAGGAPACTGQTDEMIDSIADLADLLSS